MTQTSPKRIALFPGTFDPFTTGHMSIVKRGLNILDEIIIAIGVMMRNVLISPRNKDLKCCVRFLKMIPA